MKNVITFFRMLPYLWMHVRGRWFVFRNAPDDVVEFVAMLCLPDLDEDMQQFVLSAREEKSARLQRR